MPISRRLRVMSEEKIRCHRPDTKSASETSVIPRGDRRTLKEGGMLGDRNCVVEE